MRTFKLPKSENRNTSEVEYQLKRKAKKGKKTQRNEARDLLLELSPITSQLIHLGNEFRRVARNWSALDGSNWRHNRHAQTAIVRAVAKHLYHSDPYDTSNTIAVEEILQKVLERSLKPRGGK